MNDELDPGLRRLFAQTAEHPADDAFVAAVTARTARDRRLSLALRPLAAGALSAATLGGVAAGLGLAAQQSFAVIAPLLTASPVGQAAGLGLAVAGLVCFRLLAPLATRRF
jgi:hypothetical protein